MWSFIIASVCLFWVDVPKDNSDAIKPDGFEGTWFVVSTETEGKTTTTKTKTESIFVFKGNGFANILEGKPNTKATFVIDSSKNPKRMEIDFETPCGTQGKIHAIYEFKRDGTVRLAFIDKNASETFETKGNENRVLNLKRVKP